MRYRLSSLRFGILLIIGAIISSATFVSQPAYADGQNTTIDDLMALNDQYIAKSSPNDPGLLYSVTIKTPLFRNGEYTYVPSNPGAQGVSNTLKCQSLDLPVTMLMNPTYLYGEFNNSGNQQLKKPEFIRYGMTIAPTDTLLLSEKCPELIADLQNVKGGRAQPKERSVVVKQITSELDKELYVGSGKAVGDPQWLNELKKDQSIWVKWCNTSSRGVDCKDDSKLRNEIGYCINDARAKAADASRYNKKEATEDSRRPFFASCLSQRLYGNESKTPVFERAARSFNIMESSIAGKDARQARAKEMLEGLQEDLKWPVNEGGQSEEAKATCGTEVTGVGYIMCPLLTAAAGFADSMWSLFEGLLKTDPLQGGSGSFLYQTWAGFRDIANTLLVIVFLVIVFSQVTSLGISNYGVKKMLPRIIIIAIAINLSFILMQTSIDLANVLGSTLLDLITKAGGAQTLANLDNVGWVGLIADITTLGLTTVAVGAVGAAAVTIAGAPAALIFMALLILPAIIGFIAGTLALMMRTALLPIIAILAPLALAAYVLPNTQSIFDRWRKTFTSMLLLYPLAAIYYGALKLAAMTLISTGGTLARLSGLAMLFMGTFVVFWLAIKSNSIVGKMTGAVQGAFSKITSPAEKLGRETMGSMAKENKGAFMGKTYAGRGPKNWLGRGMQRFDRSKRTRDVQTAIHQGDADQSYQQWLLKNPGAMGNVDPDTSPTGKAYLSQLTQKAVQNQEANISTQDINTLGQTLRQAIMDNDTIKAQAAQNMLLKSGPPGLDGFNSVLDTHGAQMQDSLRGDMKVNLKNNHGGVMDKDNATMKWATDNNTVDMQQAQTAAMADVAAKGMPPEKFSGLSEKAQLRILNNASAAGALDADTLRVLGDANSTPGSKLSKEVRARINAMPAPPAAPGSPGAAPAAPQQPQAGGGNQWGAPIQPAPNAPAPNTPAPNAPAPNTPAPNAPAPNTPAPNAPAQPRRAAPGPNNQNTPPKTP